MEGEFRRLSSPRPRNETTTIFISYRWKKTSPFQEWTVKVSRFTDPVSQEEMEVAAQCVVPDNTKHNNEWLSIILLSCSDEKLLCKRYIMETQQVSGKTYTPKSIYALLCWLLRMVHSNGVVHNFLLKVMFSFVNPIRHYTLSVVICIQKVWVAWWEEISYCYYYWKWRVAFGKLCNCILNFWWYYRTYSHTGFFLILIFLHWRFFFAFYLIISVSHFNECVL